MITIPFMKLHGAENDFLLTWDEEAPASDLPVSCPAYLRPHDGYRSRWMDAGMAKGGRASNAFVQLRWQRSRDVRQWNTLCRGVWALSWRSLATGDFDSYRGRVPNICV